MGTSDWDIGNGERAPIAYAIGQYRTRVALKTDYGEFYSSLNEEPNDVRKDGRGQYWHGHTISGSDRYVIIDGRYSISIGEIYVLKEVPL